MLTHDNHNELTDPPAEAGHRFTRCRDVDHAAPAPQPREGDRSHDEGLTPDPGEETPGRR
ncbi:hypothetical protein GCM10027610_035760 [Dactylosporangium cerinum]